MPLNIKRAAGEARKSKPHWQTLSGFGRNADGNGCLHSFCYLLNVRRWSAGDMSDQRLSQPDAAEPALMAAAFSSASGQRSAPAAAIVAGIASPVTARILNVAIPSSVKATHRNLGRCPPAFVRPWQIGAKTLAGSLAVRVLPSITYYAGLTKTRAWKLIGLSPRPAPKAC